MREALINAIVHNDFSREIPPVFEIFSDRIVFTSYGGLLPGQSEEDFFSCSSMPRNRELMRVFKDLGLVEQLGSGMSRILQHYDKDIFEISEHFIKVIFPFSRYSDSQKSDENYVNVGVVREEVRKKYGKSTEKARENKELLSEKQQIIVQHVRDHGSISNRDVQQLLAVKDSRALKMLRELVEMGILKKIGKSKGSYYVLFEK